MICNQAGNPCDADTLALLQSSSVKTKPFDLNGRTLCARLIRCHDADTIVVTIVVNPGDVHKISCRLLGFDAPEMATKNLDEKKKSIAIRKVLLRLLAPEIFDDESDWAVEKDITTQLDKNMVLLHVKLQEPDKYGRTLSTIYRNADDKESLNDIMIKTTKVDQYGGGHKLRSWDKKE